MLKRYSFGIGIAVFVVFALGRASAEDFNCVGNPLCEKICVKESICRHPCSAVRSESCLQLKYKGDAERQPLDEPKAQDQDGKDWVETMISRTRSIFNL